ncbi:hypothetical protein OB236_38330 [Paenibacillus sp. WQ 127069]|uniref:DUF3168 domain-containing protein n=1 Tax=Paenibacillus baimaensis TaxID=2982185 RepID=A0ABT2UTN6_9BACL|nr:hypothetical protein [Paenibacillus sp. WQ 127069]MCU6797999.1 hypothetical protein [Paenibacillus sp. WQ 127069]
MSLNLIDAIYSTCKRDAEFMAFFGFTPSSPAAEITGRLIRGMEPDQTLTGSNVPQVLIYTKPGRFASNPLVFEGKFCFDIYAKTSYQAKQIGSRVFQLFHDKRVHGTTLHTYLCVMAYDSDLATGITGVKGYEMIFDVDYLRTN